MRTLNADLTTAQRSASPIPFIELRFFSRDKAILRVFCTTDDPNRIMAVQQAEGTTNGHIVSPGNQPYSILIRLRDHDNTISGLDFKGFRVEIGWGFNTTSGDRVSYGPMGFVHNQRVVSLPGEVYVELLCMSSWDKIAISWPNSATSSVLEFNQDQSVRHILQEVLGGSELAAAIADDGGVFTDETTASKNTTTNDVTLLPATPVVDDAYYFGLSTRFDRISIDMTTVGVGTWEITWEYYNGTNFNNTLRVATSGKAAFLTGEMIIIDVELPSDAATTTVNSQGPFFYIRARVSSFTSITTQPKATRVFANVDFGFQIDSSDSGQGDDFQPEYKSDYTVLTRTMVQHMLEYTKMGIKVLPDGFHMLFVDEAQASPDYTYDTTHDSYNSSKGASLIIPNKIIYVDRDPAAEDSSVVTGSDEDTVSSGAIGTIPVVILEPSISSSGEADTLAARHIKRLQNERQQGSVTAPMNVGQEIWDEVRVVDARSGLTFDGRVTHILREFEPGKYEIQITLGGTALVVQADPLEEQRRAEQLMALEDFEGPIPTLQELTRAAADRLFINELQQIIANRLALEADVRTLAERILTDVAQAGDVPRPVPEIAPEREPIRRIPGRVPTPPPQPVVLDSEDII